MYIVHCTFRSSDEMVFDHFSIRSIRVSVLNCPLFSGMSHLFIFPFYFELSNPKHWFIPKCETISSIFSMWLNWILRLENRLSFFVGCRHCQTLQRSHRPNSFHIWLSNLPFFFLLSFSSFKRLGIRNALCPNTGTWIYDKNNDIKCAADSNGFFSSLFDPNFLIFDPNIISMHT